MGMTIPDEIAIFFEGCYFSIEKSGACIIATSGASIFPTKEEILNYGFEDCKIT
jgi:hypothetical protein